MIDGAGGVLLPGLVDLHTHLREPGREDAETVSSGSAAAALGGYTAVFAMPNTDPAADTAGVVEQVWRLGRETGLVDVAPIGAVTVGRAGTQLAELGAMADSAAGVRVFSDDGACVADPAGWGAYAIVAGISEDALASRLFLVDAQGWLRAVLPADDTSALRDTIAEITRAPGLPAAVRHHH